MSIMMAMMMSLAMATWKAGEAVSENEVALVGIENCFTVEEISDSVF